MSQQGRPLVGPMTGTVLDVLLVPMVAPFHRAAMRGWADYLYLRAANDRVPLAPSTHGLMLRDCVAFHLESEMRPVVDAGYFAQKDTRGLKLYIARSRAGYDSALAVKINATDSQFRVRDPKSEFAELRFNQEAVDLPLLGIFDEPIPGSDEIGTWITAAYCADDALSADPALAFSCQCGDNVLWKTYVDVPNVMNSSREFMDRRAAYDRRLRELERRSAGEA